MEREMGLCLVKIILGLHWFCISSDANLKWAKEERQAYKINKSISTLTTTPWLIISCIYLIMFTFSFYWCEFC